MKTRIGLALLFAALLTLGAAAAFATPPPGHGNGKGHGNGNGNLLTKHDDDASTGTTGTAGTAGTTGTTTTTESRKVTLCHRTGSWKHRFHKITVSLSAVRAHLRHGDTLPGVDGTCTTPTTTGTTTTTTTAP